MNEQASPSLTEELAAAHEWWREAGVDLAFTDVTTSWLREPEEEPAAERAAPVHTKAEARPAPLREKIGGGQDAWPQSLDAFAPWWLSEPSLGTGSRPRIAPRGKHGAKLMILVPEPEAGDTETLLSGPWGKLLASFLSAAGVEPDETYLAAALPRHTPHPDWPALAQAGLGEILLHHIGLAAPQRVLAFGQAISPLIGHDLAQNRPFLLQINHQAASIPFLADRSLEHLLAKPAARSRFWQRWLDWTGN